MKKQAYRFLATLSVAGLLAVSSVQGYSEVYLTANIPFTFTVGEVTFQPGQYSIMHYRPGYLFVRSADNQVKAIVPTASAHASVFQNQTKLVFRQYGDQYFLAQVYTPGVEYALFKSRQERELAKRAPAPQMVSFDVQRRQ